MIFRYVDPDTVFDKVLCKHIIWNLKHIIWRAEGEHLKVDERLGKKTTNEDNKKTDCQGRENEQVDSPNYNVPN